MANRNPPIRDRIQHDLPPIRDRIHVDFDIDEMVNYSLLHNNRELLNTLTLTKLLAMEVRGYYGEGRAVRRGRRAIRTAIRIWSWATRAARPGAAW